MYVIIIVRTFCVSDCASNVLRNNLVVAILFCVSSCLNNVLWVIVAVVVLNSLFSRWHHRQ